MKKYFKPELDVLELDILDVIQASDGMTEGDGSLNLGDGELELNSLNIENGFNVATINYLGK